MDPFERMTPEATIDKYSQPANVLLSNECKQVALDKLFGLEHRLKIVPGARGLHRVVQGEALPAATPAFGNLHQAYVTFTGDTELRQFGTKRVQAIFNTPSFESALADTLNALLVKDYNTDYRWRDLVTSTTAPPDYRTKDRVRLKHIEDLPELIEDEPFDELIAHGDEKVSSAISTHGGLIVITRRAVLNDDVAAIQRAVAQASRAAWRTLAKKIWNKLINNDTYDADGLPCFDANHGNLGSSALAVASLTAAREAIFGQTEPGSSERLGLSGPFLLAVPIELEATALAINGAERIAATDDANPWYQRFGPNSERIFANPLFEDADDWMLFDTSGNVEIITLAFLQDRQTPQIVLANTPTADQQFSQDRLVYQVRFEFDPEIADYRGAYKAVVAA